MNVASRLESSGVPGRIQVSEHVAQILTKHGQFELECRGPIEVKGKGRLTTYLVITPYDSLPDSLTAADRPPEGLCGQAAGTSPLEAAEEIEEPPEVADDDEVTELGGSADGDEM